MLQGDPMCKDCFYYAFEEEIHHTIVAGKLFSPGETVAIGASGGKGRWQHFHNFLDFSHVDGKICCQ